MNPLLCMASEPYLTNPTGYPGRHVRPDEDQARADCIRLDFEVRDSWLHPGSHYPARHTPFAAKQRVTA